MQGVWGLGCRAARTDIHCTCNASMQKALQTQFLKWDHRSNKIHKSPRRPHPLELKGLGPNSVILQIRLRSPPDSQGQQAIDWQYPGLRGPGKWCVRIVDVLFRAEGLGRTCFVIVFWDFASIAVATQLLPSDMLVVASTPLSSFKNLKREQPLLDSSLISVIIICESFLVLLVLLEQSSSPSSSRHKHMYKHKHKQQQRQQKPD